MQNNHEPRTVHATDPDFVAAVERHLWLHAIEYGDTDLIMARFRAIDPSIAVDIDTAVARYIDADLADLELIDIADQRDLLIALAVVLSDA